VCPVVALRFALLNGVRIMTRHQKVDQKPDRESKPDKDLSPPPNRSRAPRHLLPEAKRPLRGDVPRNGVQILTFSTPVAGPPTLMVVENDGRHVMEEQALVGWISASFDRKHVLELYGIDLRYAIHNPSTGRWERCLFSCPLADMLEMLAAEDEFPFSFDATPSQAEANWAALKARGQTERPMFPLKTYITAATAESLAAVADDDRMRVRRGHPRDEAGIDVDKAAENGPALGGPIAD